MIKKTLLKICGMHCTSCVLNMDGELEDTEGVMSASTNYARGQTEVTYDDEKITAEEIISIISKLGYSAEQSSPN